MPGTVQEDGFLLVDSADAATSCHTNTYAPILDAGGATVGWTGVGIGAGAGTGMSIRFTTAVGGRTLGTPLVPLASSTVEVWSDLPSSPGAIRLYAGAWAAIPAGLDATLSLGVVASPTIVDLLWVGAPDLVGGRVLTNWHFCWSTTDAPPPPPPPPIPPLLYTRVDASRYTLELAQTVDRGRSLNPFVRGLGDRVGVWNTELAWEDVPTLVDRVGWAWTAAPSPLGESLVVTTRLAGLPRTRSDGTATGLILGMPPGLGLGALA